MSDQLYTGPRHMVSSISKPLDADETLLRPDPMSDATVEAVARAFCKRMGLDPDARLYPDSPQLWEFRRENAREAIAMHLAVQLVLG